MKTLKELIRMYNQSVVAKKSGLSQANISEAYSNGRVIYGQEVGNALTLFELRRIDKVNFTVKFPRLAMTDIMDDADDVKKIVFEGRSFEVPLWAKFLAADEVGNVHAFEEKPRRNIYGSWSVGYGKKSRKIYERNNWRNSLVGV